MILDKTNKINIDLEGSQNFIFPNFQNAYTILKYYFRFCYLMCITPYQVKNEGLTGPALTKGSKCRKVSVTPIPFANLLHYNKLSIVGRSCSITGWQHLAAHPDMHPKRHTK